MCTIDLSTPLHVVCDLSLFNPYMKFLHCLVILSCVYCSAVFDCMHCNCFHRPLVMICNLAVLGSYTLSSLS